MAVESAMCNMCEGGIAPMIWKCSYFVPPFCPTISSRSYRFYCNAIVGVSDRVVMSAVQDYTKETFLDFLLVKINDGNAGKFYISQACKKCLTY